MASLFHASHHGSLSDGTAAQRMSVCMLSAHSQAEEFSEFVLKRRQGGDFSQQSEGQSWIFCDSVRTEDMQQCEQTILDLPAGLLEQSYRHRSGFWFDLLACKSSEK